MPHAIILQQSPATEELARKRSELTAVRELLAERESAVAELRNELRGFEGLYLRQVGCLYAELDEWEARIAEREVALYDSDAARQRAESARKRAADTHDAAFGDGEKAEAFEPSASLKSLFREVAKRIHPDFARNSDEQSHCTRLMMRANRAYSAGDAEALQRILDDYHEVADTDGEGVAEECTRLDRQIAQANRDIGLLEEELRVLPKGEIAQLKEEADAARKEGRDLLAELAAGLREKVADAARRYEFTHRQMYAHGR